MVGPLRSYNFTKFMLNFFPKPDLWVFLNPPLKTVKTRKLELSDKELKRQTNSYSNLFRHKKNVLRFNTISPKKKMILQIVKKVNKLSKKK